MELLLLDYVINDHMDIVFVVPLNDIVIQDFLIFLRDFIFFNHMNVIFIIIYNRFKFFSLIIQV